MSGPERRNENPGRWEEVETEFLQDCRVFTVSQATAKSPRDGTHHPFFRIDSVDWVNIVPLTADDDVVMVKQYRHGLREITLETPGGMVDPGENPETAAVRELLEETGYRAGKVHKLGSMNPNPALFGNRLHSFVAYGCEHVGEVSNDEREETVVELVPRRKLRELAVAGEVDHALVLAALHYLDLYEERKRGS
jgi:8-oxo-dGTP pyrophosphatase MutT (NUDIX family)